MVSDYYPECGVSEYEEFTYKDYIALYGIEFDEVYDLIQAGIVEKINKEEENDNRQVYTQKQKK